MCSGDPSLAFAAFLDPGRVDVSSPWRPHRCCPRDSDGEGLGHWLISGLTAQLRHLLSYASRFALPLTRKARFRLAGSAFTGWESNPLDRGERFQLTIISPSCSPLLDFAAHSRRRRGCAAHPGYGTGTGKQTPSSFNVTEMIPEQLR
jgi:hypothetical protein